MLPVAVEVEYVPGDRERLVRALMLVLDIEGIEIDRLLRERRERIIRDEGLAA